MSPTTTPDTQIAALVDAQAAARANLTSQAVSVATAAARSFRGWYDHAQISDWAAELATRIESIQRVQAQATDAYLARATSSLAGGRVRPVGRVDVDSLRTGVTHAGTYARAADVYRWQQSQIDATATQLAEAVINGPEAFLAGAPVNPPEVVDPIEAAIGRVQAVADMDVQLADRAQSTRFLTDQANRREIRGWRRVIHPEESRGGSCGLCIAATDRIYYVEELRAVHGKCKCTTLPIVGRHDPGNSLNSLDLKKLYEHAGGTTSGTALKRTRYQINQHGELGPVLTFEKDSWRGPQQTAKDTNAPRKARTPQQDRATLERVLGGQEQAIEKAHALAKADPKKWGPYAAKLDERVAELRADLAALNPL